jgi:hypothetical protein
LDEVRDVQVALTRRYGEDCGVGPGQWPTRCDTEVVRLKRYRQGDCFPPHVDVVDAETSRRFLAFLWCLKEPVAGGETRFPHLDLAFKPVAGACLVFPPVWTYQHEGSRAVGEKVIMSSYLHYPSSSSDQR